MTRDPDDEALSWGDDDPSHVSGPAAAQRTAHDPDEDPSAAGSAVLVGYGILAGVYLLYGVGWFVAVQRDTFEQPGLFIQFMYQLGQFFAIAAAPIWFGATFALVRRTTARILWLVAGAAVLVPWPFVMGA